MHMGEIVAAILASIFQMPWEMLIATPFLLAAVLIWFVTRRFLSITTQLVLTTCIASMGLAPAYGAHFSMVPIYTLLIAGYRSPTDAAISFAVTWAVMLLGIAFFMWFYRWKKSRITSAGEPQRS